MKKFRVKSVINYRNKESAHFAYLQIHQIHLIPAAGINAQITPEFLLS